MFMTREARESLTTELVEAVKAHAVAHYEQGGWDIVVECWSDDDVREAIGTAESPRTAVKNVRRAVAPVGEYRDEIQSLAF